MSIHDYVDEVLRAPLKGTWEQSVVYAIERLVEREVPTRRLSFDEACALIEDIALEEDVEVPTVERIRSTQWAGVACHKRNVIGLQSSVTALVVVHEFAHIVAGFGHDDLWRSKFVDLTRQHVSVQHASLLHHLYNRAGLSVDHWQA